LEVCLLMKTYFIHLVLHYKLLNTSKYSVTLPEYILGPVPHILVEYS
jgi:hypothetical protein